MHKLVLSPLFRILAAVVAAIALVFASGFLIQQAPWQFSESHALAAALAAGALIVAILLCWIVNLKRRNIFWKLITVIGIGCLICVPLFALYVMLADGGFNQIPPLIIPKPVVIALLLVFFALLIINSLPLTGGWLLLLNAVLVGVFAYPVLGQDARSSLAAITDGRKTLFDDSVKYIYSSVHDVKLTEYSVFKRPLDAAGGGLGIIDDERLLLVTGMGEVRLAQVGPDSVQLTDQVLDTPFDRDAYREGAENPSNWFRLTDALLQETDSDIRELVISYHHWDNENTCLAMRVATTEVNVAQFGEEPLTWDVRYTSEPCMQAPLYNGTGGRMTYLDDDSILLTVGESFGDWTDEALADSDYGKIHLIDRTNWTTRIFTTGHRNPQGLLIDGEDIWSTEHGPHGGDELNLISEGTDYGWPAATYGTAYGKKNWPKNDTPGDHTFGQKPVYAWVPSIGISNLIKVRGSKFKSWQGDFMVSSLYGRDYGKSLFRVKVYDEQVRVSERLKTGRPIRDLVEMNGGNIVLWDGTQTMSVLEPASLVFSTCSGCHAMRWRTHGIGPDLINIVGEKVAHHKDFAYSDTLKKMGGVWSRERLDQFIKNPKAFAPGTSMNFPGIEDAEERKAIIDYLENLTPPPG